MHGSPSRLVGHLAISCERELASTLEHSRSVLLNEIVEALHRVRAEVKIIVEHLFDVQKACQSEKLAASLADHGYDVSSFPKGRIRASVTEQVVSSVLTFKGEQQIKRQEERGGQKKKKNQQTPVSSAVPSQRIEASLVLSDRDIQLFSAGRMMTTDQLLKILQPYLTGFSIRIRGECPAKLQRQMAGMMGISVESHYPAVHVDVFPTSEKVLVKTDIEMPRHDGLDLARGQEEDLFSSCAIFLGIDPSILYSANGNSEGKKSAFAREQLGELHSGAALRDIARMHGANHDSRSLRDLISSPLRALVFNSERNTAPEQI